MALIFSAPSKTFLAGEYLALDGGPTLLVTTEPRFEMEVTKGTGRLTGLGEGSPAARFISRHGDFFASLNLQFRDPFRGAGGWGASTAQYLCAFALWSWKNAANDESVREIDTKQLMGEYLQDAWSGQGRAPSGADLIAQLKGGFVFFERRAGLISRTAWPFADLEAVLIRTGQKVPTHEHLRGLGEIETSGLQSIMERLQRAWNAADSAEFVAAIQAYGEELARLQFVAPATTDLMKEWGSWASVRAIKGCGALGADVILAIVDRSRSEEFRRALQTRSLDFIFARERLSAGLELQVRSRVELEGGLA